MENNNELNNFLSDKMSVDELNLQAPDLALVFEARKKVMARKKAAGEINDFFSIIATFLNFKIKLNHAVFATIVTGSIILYVTQNKPGNKIENRSDDYVSNIASVRSSTVLSSIYTFGLNKTQHDGRARN